MELVQQSCNPGGPSIIGIRQFTNYLSHPKRKISSSYGLHQEYEFRFKSSLGYVSQHVTESNISQFLSSLCPPNDSSLHKYQDTHKPPIHLNQPPSSSWYLILWEITQQYQRRRIISSASMAASFSTSTSPLASQPSAPKSHYSGLRRSCFKLEPFSPSHVLFHQQVGAQLRVSTTQKPCKGVVAMAGSGKVMPFLHIVEIHDLGLFCFCFIWIDSSRCSLFYLGLLIDQWG